MFPVFADQRLYIRFMRKFPVDTIQWFRLVLCGVVMLPLMGLAQSYTVVGADDYVKPQYLVMYGANSDLLGIHRRFQTELKRSGFQLISYDEMNRMVHVEEADTHLAELIEGASEKMGEQDLKSVMARAGMNWFSGGKQSLQRLIVAGLVGHTEEKEQMKFRTQKWNYYQWNDGMELPEAQLKAPDTFHLLTFNYTYRESLSCGKTLTEIHGSVNEVSDGRNDPMVRFEFRQPQLSSRCPHEIIPALVNKMVSTQTGPSAVSRAQRAEIDFEWMGDTLAMRAVSTVLLVPKAGKDCQEIESQDISDQLALGLLKVYDVIDRSAMESILSEQKFAMGGLIRDSDWIEAGELAGAEGILTMQNMCLSGSNILKAKLISVNSSLVLWSAIVTDHAGTPDPRLIAERVVRTLQTL